MADDEPAGITAFKSGHTLSRWAIAFLLFVVIAYLAYIVSDYMQIKLVEGALRGGMITFAEATANDNRQAAIGTVVMIASIVSVIIMLVWLYRAYKNLTALNSSDLFFLPGWAVAGFFIPIWNFFHPIFVMRDLWKASDPSVDIEDSKAWKKAPTSPFIFLWWLLNLIAFFVTYVVNQWSDSLTSLREIYNMSWAILIIHLLTMFYFLLSIELVHAIDGRQTKKAKLIADYNGIKVMPDSFDSVIEAGE